jgi:hypothetical protein
MNYRHLLLATHLICAPLIAEGSDITASAIAHTITSHLKKNTGSIHKAVTKAARKKQRDDLSARFAVLKEKKSAALAHATTLNDAFDAAREYLKELDIQAALTKDSALKQEVDDEQAWLKEVEKSCVKAKISRTEVLPAPKEKKKK